MAHKWQKLREQVYARPGAPERLAQMEKAMTDALALAKLREEREVTQVELAATLGVSQPNISRIERGDDIYLSTLSRYVAALGGSLEVLAVFPDQTVRLTPPPDPLAETEEPAASEDDVPANVRAG